MLKTAHRYGYDAIEPRLGSKHTHGIELDTTSSRRKSIRDQIAESNVNISCLASSLSYADSSKTDEMIAGTHESIDLAGDLAVPAIRVFGGVIPDGIERQKAIDLLVKSFKKVANHAAERGVAVCFETHDDWCDPNHVAKVLEAVNHPAIAVNWDIMHPVRRGNSTMREAFNILKPWIRHVHIHDGNIDGDIKFMPIGTGCVDHRIAVECLMSMNYSGYLSGEWINWEDYDICLPRELAKMKHYEQRSKN